ncbi:uncharacterized protein ACBR49_014176 [Aulostomus maculatus]
MKWVLHDYLSQDMLADPDLAVDIAKDVDLLLVIEWTVKAKDNLLKNVQKEVRRCLEKILEMEQTQSSCDSEEAFMGLAVDIIQCIDANSKNAQQISAKLSDRVREVCFQELRLFVESYHTEQARILKEPAELAQLQTIHFLKTLKTCTELRQHVQTRAGGINAPLVQEIVAVLVNMENVTLKTLLKRISDSTEKNLKAYFKSNDKRFVFINALKTFFPEKCFCLEVQKRVVTEAYKLITQLYLKHLVKSKRRHLQACWSPRIGIRVGEDAELLHQAMSDLAPGVEECHIMLLQVSELLECKNPETVELEVAFMLQRWATKREDLELLLSLLRWMGLSKRHVKEALDHQPRPSSATWCSCFFTTGEG